MQEIEEKIQNNEKGGRVYELGYLLVPNIEDDKIGASYTAIKDLVVSLGGEIISDDMPQMITLAYEMDKVVSNIHHRYNNAYFGWVKFDMDPANTLELKKKLDLDATVIRFIIIKTVRENTLASKRFVGKDVRRKPYSAKKEGEPEVVGEINKEEIDKEIEAMVAV